ncbi:hypothetical protein [Algimonas ampicilliniresistens]|uniref:hypothetical protein n=1 Tax=Algimonas ampicilliniresistens TaxID=1298735 RepID=UPI0024E0A305|nr:hypothetical protein [Algimonas ampicilliniresistens]
MDGWGFQGRAEIGRVDEMFGRVAPHGPGARAAALVAGQAPHPVGPRPLFALAMPSGLAGRGLRMASDEDEADPAADLCGDLEASALGQVRSLVDVDDDRARPAAAQGLLGRPEGLVAIGGLDENEVRRVAIGAKAPGAEGSRPASDRNPEDPSR